MPESKRRRYVRRADRPVVAVCLQLDMGALVYRKWGARQRAKRGDWIVDNDGEVYTVDAAVFARTYRRTGPGNYVKITPVWAERAMRAGSVRTKEGLTHYKAGDYVVSNVGDESDEYAIGRKKFEALYKPERRRDRRR